MGACIGECSLAFALPRRGVDLLMEVETSAA
jgi:hypothetical protein